MFNGIMIYLLVVKSRHVREMWPLYEMQAFYTIAYN